MNKTPARRGLGLLLGCQIRSEERGRMKISTPQRLSFAKPIGKYYAIIAISRHEKNNKNNNTETEPKP